MGQQFLASTKTLTGDRREIKEKVHRAGTEQVQVQNRHRHLKGSATLRGSQSEIVTGSAPSSSSAMMERQ